MPQLKGLLSLGAPPTTVDPQGLGDSGRGAAPSAPWLLAPQHHCFNSVSSGAWTPAPWALSGSVWRSVLVVPSRQQVTVLLIWPPGHQTEEVVGGHVPASPGLPVSSSSHPRLMQVTDLWQSVAEGQHLGLFV